MAVTKFIKNSLFVFNFLFWIYGTSLSNSEMQYVIILTGTGCFPGWAPLNNLNMKLIGCVILGVEIHIKVNYFGSQFFIGLLLIFILLLAAGILGAVAQSQPCVTYVTNIMKKNVKIVAGIGFAIGVVMLIGMSFAMTLYCQIGRKGGVTTS